MKKILAVALVVATISSIGFALPEIAEKIETSITEEATVAEEKEIAIPYPYYNEYPELLVLKGVAVKGDDVVSAVFLAVEKESNGYKNIYLLIDGKSYELELEKTKFDKETGTIIAEFSENLRLIGKNHIIDYRNIFTVTGQFGEYLLNMRLVGSLDYRILETTLLEKNPAIEQLAEKIVEE